MHNQLEPHLARAADQAKTNLLTIAAQRRREMERDLKTLAVPPIIDIQPMPMEQNSILPMWSALHD